MEPVHTISPPPHNAFPGHPVATVYNNMQSGYTAPMAFYAQQELRSQSTQGQFQHYVNVVPTSNCRNQKSVNIDQSEPTKETTSEKITLKDLINQENLNRLKELVAACRANPNILYMPELTFFKEYLESLKAVIPDKNNKQKVPVATVKPMVEGEDYEILSGITPFKCKHCGKCCKSKKYMKRHMASHTGSDGTHKCNQCGKIFGYASSLGYHMRAHKGEKPFSCKECGKAFSQNNRLEMHMRTHTGERPYKCDQCQKTFRQYNALTTHLLIHSDEKPFQCNICDKYFKSKDHLTKHTNRNHAPRERKFKCSECDKAFYDKPSLKYHMKKHPAIIWHTPEIKEFP